MYRKILVGIDIGDDEACRKALSPALDLCRNYGAELHMLTVVPDLPTGVIDMYLSEDTGRKLVKSAEQGLKRFADENVPEEIKSYRHVETGTAYMKILEKADEITADLIVIGSHRPGMGDFLIGPNAARVVRHARVSVLVARD